MNINSIKTKDRFHNFIRIKQLDNTSPIEVLLCDSKGALLSNLNEKCTVSIYDAISREVRQVSDEQIVDGVLSFKIVNELLPYTHKLEVTTFSGVKFPADDDFQIFVSESHNSKLINIIKSIPTELALKVVTQQVMNRFNSISDNFVNYIKKGEVTVNDLDVREKKITKEYISDDLINSIQSSEALSKENQSKFTSYVKKGEVTVGDIDKNKGLLDGTYFTDKFKSELSKGNINVTNLLDSSVTTPKIADRAVTPSKANFFSNTKNLFNGTYHKIFVSGAVGTTSAFLYNNDTNRRTAIVPVVAGKAYYVKSHDPLITDNFRIGLNQTIPNSYDELHGNVKIASVVAYNDVLKEGSFTSDITGYAFITVSKSGQEPRLQVEEGTAATSYVPTNRVLNENVMPVSIKADIDSAKTISQDNKNLLDKIVVKSKVNLFDGQYYKYNLGGSIGGNAIITNSNTNARTVIFPIITGETYSVSIYDKELSDRFILGVHTKMPTFATGTTENLTKLLVYNNVVKQHTFTSDLNGFAFLLVSSTGQEPRIQIEKGDKVTPYTPPLNINHDYIDESINSNTKVSSALKNSERNRNILERNQVFPKVTNVSYTKTDPGARFIDYFDNKMWGYTGGDGTISYSTDDGGTWTAYTKSWDTADGWINRLMKTADGEVIAMTGNVIKKSSGWSTGIVTWSTNKITKSPNSTLFQFSLDGNGTKFIACEYGASIPNWSDSRFVWISTDKGETWNVVWDSLEKLGEEKNAETHLHGVAYDRWDDRFYFTQGHGRNGG
ncbi:WD40/YVTN/BNR-like repeat-containing protein, partial [Macrococcoides caseolyticum]|uniref:WD40/YVTN/BNR-like repeat-containing protein n=1 Tax=Macrococcoides caseolyticum TaxID=69966 RepID=UPI000CBB4B28